MLGTVVTPDMLQRGGGGRKCGAKERGDHNHARHDARAIPVSSGNHAAVSKHVIRKHLMENRSKTKFCQEESKQNAENNVMNSILKSPKFKKPEDYENDVSGIIVPAKRVKSTKCLSFGDALHAASGKKNSRSKQTAVRSSSAVDSPDSGTNKKEDAFSLTSKKLFEFEDPEILLSFDNSSEGMNKDDGNTLVLTDGPRRSSRRRRDKKLLEPQASLKVKRSMPASSKLRALANLTHDDFGSVDTLKSNKSTGSSREGMSRVTKSAASTKVPGNKSNEMALQLSQEDEEVLARIAQELTPSSTYSFGEQPSFGSGAAAGSGTKSVRTKSSRSTTSKTATATTTSSKQPLMFGREDPIVLITSQEDDSDFDDDESKINRVLSIEMTLEEAEVLRKKPEKESMVHHDLQDRRKGLDDLDSEGIGERTKDQSEMQRRRIKNAAILGASAAVAGTAAAAVVADRTKSRKERSHRGSTKQVKNLTSTEKLLEGSEPANSGRTGTPSTERNLCSTRSKLQNPKKSNKERRKEENNDEMQFDATGKKHRKTPKKQHHTTEKEDNEVIVSGHKSERTKKSSRERNESKKKVKLPVERTTGLSSPNKVVIKQENAKHGGRKERRTRSKSGFHDESGRSIRSTSSNKNSTTKFSSDGSEGPCAINTDTATVENGKADGKNVTDKEEKDNAEKEEKNVVKDEVKEIATKQTSDSRAAFANDESDFKTISFGSSMFANLSLTGSTLGQWLGRSSTSEGALTPTASPSSLFSKKSEMRVSSVLTEVMNEEDDKDDDDAKSVKTSVTAPTEATSSTSGSSSTQGRTATVMKAMDHEMKYHQERLLKLEAERKNIEKESEKRRQQKEASKKADLAHSKIVSLSSF